MQMPAWKMRRRWRVAVAIGLATVGPGFARAESVRAPQERPITEPAFDESGDYIWWDGAYNMTFYQLGKVLDLYEAGRGVGEEIGLVEAREALNVLPNGEVADSTWFANRHAKRRLSPGALARGPNRLGPPSPTGALMVLSGKSSGETPGFVLEDERGGRYVVKFDPPVAPEMATGAEIVSSKILHALGWNVPEYYLLDLDPSRLVLAPGAWCKDEYNEKRPMTQADLRALLARVARMPDGRFRASASRFVPGVPKGPFKTLGVRADDPNDRIPHQHRRELRGLRVVASWINYHDARRGNFLDTFVPIAGHPQGRGYLEHYLLDFSSTLGSGGVVFKEPKLGHEYVIDPGIVLRSLFSLGLWVKPWEDPTPVVHQAVGRFDVENFEPDDWKTSYPQPLFDHATVRDKRWGAKLVASFTDRDLRTVVRTGQWSDPAAEEELFRILRGRRDRIVAEYLDDGSVPRVRVAQVPSGAGG